MEKPENYDEEIRKYHHGIKKVSELPDDCKYYHKVLRYIKKHPDQYNLLNLSPEEYDKAVNKLKRESISIHQKEIHKNFTPDQQETWRERSRQQYKNMSEDDKIKRTLKQKNTWKNKPMEELKAHAEHSRNQWESLPADEKSHRIEKMQSYWSPEKRIMHGKSCWENMSSEEKEYRINILRDSLENWKSNLSEDDIKKYKDKLSISKKEWWDSLSEREKNEVITKSKNNSWIYKDEEYQNKIKKKMSNIKKARWKNMTYDEKETILKRLNEGNKKYWQTISDDDKQKIIDNLVEASKKWRDNLTDEQRIERSNKLREVSINYRNSLDDNSKAIMIRKALIGSYGKNSFHKKFENIFNASIVSKYFYFVPEYVVYNNSVYHTWDYGIFDENGNLVMVLDLDGAYFHADGFDYDGIHSKLEYDVKRGLSVVHGIMIYIIIEEKLDDSFKEIEMFLSLTYDEYINKRLEQIRSQPFPYPSYSDYELMRSYGYLNRMNPDNKCFNKKYMVRNGDMLIYNFHHSIWHEGSPSVFDIWNNDESIKEMIINGYITSSILNKNKLLQGFYIHPKYSFNNFLSPGMIKIIIDKYASNYNEIFNPNNNYSEVLLASISAGKKYIGLESSDVKLIESNNLISTLLKYKIKFNAKVVKENFEANYKCLLTIISDAKCIEKYLNAYRCEMNIFIISNLDKVLSLQSLATDIDVAAIKGDKVNATQRLKIVEAKDFDENY